MVSITVHYILLCDSKFQQKTLLIKETVSRQLLVGSFQTLNKVVKNIIVSLSD